MSTFLTQINLYGDIHGRARKAGAVKRADAAEDAGAWTGRRAVDAYNAPRWLGQNTMRGLTGAWNGLRTAGLWTKDHTYGAVGRFGEGFASAAPDIQAAEAYLKQEGANVNERMRRLDDKIYKAREAASIREEQAREHGEADLATALPGLAADPYSPAGLTGAAGRGGYSPSDAALARPQEPAANPQPGGFNWDRMRDFIKTPNGMLSAAGILLMLLLAGRGMFRGRPLGGLANAAGAAAGGYGGYHLGNKLVDQFGLKPEGPDAWKYWAARMGAPVLGAGLGGMLTSPLASD